MTNLAMDNIFSKASYMDALTGKIKEIFAKNLEKFLAVPIATA